MGMTDHGASTMPPRPTEYDALLGASARLGASPRVLWRQSTPQSKALIALGSGAAAVAGVASAWTFVLYARVLEAMAVGTVDGLDAVLVGYGWLLLAQFLGSCLQFFAWSRVASGYVAVSDEKKNREDEDRERGGVEGLGACVRHVCQGATALLVAVHFGWDAIVFVGVAAAFVVGMPMAIFARARRSRSQDNDPANSPGARPMRLGKELAAVWAHADELRQLNAADVALARVKRQIESHQPHGAQPLAMAGLVLFFAVPVALGTLYAAWRVQETTPQEQNVCVRMVVMALASMTGLQCLQLSYTAYTKGDVLDIAMDKTPPLSKQEEERAKNWIVSLVGPGRRLAPMLTITNVGAALASVAAMVVLGYTFAWLLQAPYTDHRDVLGNALQLLSAIFGCALLASLALGAYIDVQSKVGRRVSDAVLLSVFGAKLKRDVPHTSDITASSVLEGTLWIGMTTPRLLAPKRVSSIITSALTAAVCFAIDPWVSLARLLAWSFGSIQTWRSKQLFRRILSDSSAPIAVLDALLRALLDAADPAATIVLVYLQVAWVADGTSTLSSVLIVALVGGMSFGMLHASRFEIGSLKRNEALTAAAKMCQFVADAREFSSLPSSRDAVVPPLSGDFTVDGPDGSRLVVRPGEIGELLVTSPSAVASALLTARELPEGLVACFGGVKTTDLPVSATMDRCMALRSDPAWLPGSIFDNIHLSAQLTMPEDVEAAARVAGVDTRQLYEELSLEQWEATPDMRKSVTVARMLLRKPDLLLVVDDDAEAAGKTWEEQVATTIRPQLHQCRVVVIRSTLA